MKTITTNERLELLSRISSEEKNLIWNHSHIESTGRYSTVHPSWNKCRNNPQKTVWLIEVLARTIDGSTTNNIYQYRYSQTTQIKTSDPVRPEWGIQRILWEVPPMSPSNSVFIFKDPSVEFDHNSFKIFDVLQYNENALNIIFENNSFKDNFSKDVYLFNKTTNQEIAVDEFNFNIQNLNFQNENSFTVNLENYFDISNDDEIEVRKEIEANPGVPLVLFRGIVRIKKQSADKLNNKKVEISLEYPFLGKREFKKVIANNDFFINQYACNPRNVNSSIFHKIGNFLGFANNKIVADESISYYNAGMSKTTEIPFTLFKKADRWVDELTTLLDAIGGYVFVDKDYNLRYKSYVDLKFKPVKKIFTDNEIIKQLSFDYTSGTNNGVSVEFDRFELAELKDVFKNEKKISVKFGETLNLKMKWITDLVVEPVIKNIRAYFYNGETPVNISDWQNYVTFSLSESSGEIIVNNNLTTEIFVDDIVIEGKPLYKYVDNSSTLKNKTITEELQEDFLTINKNKYIQNFYTARSKLVDNFYNKIKDTKTIELDTNFYPHLEIGDKVEVYGSHYCIDKISHSLSHSTGYRTRLSLIPILEPDFLNISWKEMESVNADKPALDLDLVNSIVEDKVNQGVQDAVNTSNGFTQEIKEQLEQQLAEDTIALENAMSSINTTINSEKIKVTNLTADLNKVKTDLINAETGLKAEIKIERDRITATNTNVTNIDGKVTANTTSITQLSDEIALKASQSSLDSLTGRVTTAETGITQNASQIALKASKTDLDTLTGKVTANTTAITQNANEIALKASQSSLNSLEGRVTTAETGITQNASQIALKASKTDLDSLTGRVTTAESTLTVHATQIASKVSSTTYTSDQGIVNTNVANNLLIARMATGKSLFKDPEFKNSMNGVSLYNMGGASVNPTLTRIQNPEEVSFGKVPNSSGWGLRCYSASSSNNGRSGFSWGHLSTEKREYVYKIVAAIPIGGQITFATNSLGTGFISKWLTSVEGTGKYETYYYYVKYGTGTLSSTGFFYVYKTTDINLPFIWTVAYAEVVELTSSSATEVLELGTRVTNAESSITQESNRITSEVSERTTAISGLQTQITNNKTSIDQRADSIELKAEEAKTTADLVNSGSHLVSTINVSPASIRINASKIILGTSPLDTKLTEQDSAISTAQSTANSAQESASIANTTSNDVKTAIENGNIFINGNTVFDGTANFVSSGTGKSIVINDSLLQQIADTKTVPFKCLKLEDTVTQMSSGDNAWASMWSEYWGGWYYVRASNGYGNWQFTPSYSKMTHFNGKRVLMCCWVGMVKDTAYGPPRFNMGQWGNNNHMLLSNNDSYKVTTHSTIHNPALPLRMYYKIVDVKDVIDGVYGLNSVQGEGIYYKIAIYALQESETSRTEIKSGEIGLYRNGTEINIIKGQASGIVATNSAGSGVVGFPHLRGPLNVICSIKSLSTDGSNFRSMTAYANLINSDMNTYRFFMGVTNDVINPETEVWGSNWSYTWTSCRSARFRNINSILSCGNQTANSGFTYENSGWRYGGYNGASWKPFGDTGTYDEGSVWVSTAPSIRILIYRQINDGTNELIHSRDFGFNVPLTLNGAINAQMSATTSASASVDIWADINQEYSNATKVKFFGSHQWLENRVLLSGSRVRRIVTVKTVIEEIGTENNPRERYHYYYNQETWTNNFNGYHVATVNDSNIGWGAGNILTAGKTTTVSSMTGSGEIQYFVSEI